LFINLTPLIPLSWKERGKICEEGRSPSSRPGKVRRVKERLRTSYAPDNSGGVGGGVSLLLIFFPLPWLREADKIIGPPLCFSSYR